MGVQEVYESVS